VSTEDGEDVLYCRGIDVEFFRSGVRVKSETQCGQNVRKNNRNRKSNNLSSCREAVVSTELFAAASF